METTIHHLTQIIFTPIQASIIREAFKDDSQNMSHIVKDMKAPESMATFKVYLVLLLQEGLLNSQHEMMEMLQFAKRIAFSLPSDLLREIETDNDRITLLLKVLPSYGIDHCRRILYGGTCLEQMLRIASCSHFTVERIISFFPMLQAISRKEADYRLIHPLSNIFYTLSCKSLPQRSKFPSIVNLVLRYFDTRYPTILAIPPPSSVLRLHSEGSLLPSFLWSRKTMAKLLPAAFLILGQGKVVSGRKSHFNFVEPVCFSIRITRQESAMNVELPLAVNEIANFLTGVRSAISYFSRSVREDIARLVEYEFSRTLPRDPKVNHHLAGMILTLGLLGKLRGLLPVDLLPMILSGDGLLDASSLLGLAAAKPHDKDIRSLILTNLRRFAKSSDPTPLKIDKRVRLASPLAAGLLCSTTEDSTISHHLFNIIWRYSMVGISEEEEREQFDVDYYVLHAGLGLSLTRYNSLHPNQTKQLVNLVLNGSTATWPCRWIRTSSLFALANQHVHSQNIVSIIASASLALWSFEDYLLLNTVIYTFFELPTIKAMQMHNLSSSLEALLQIVAMALGLGLRHLAGELVSTPQDLFPQILQNLGERYKITALDFNLRHQRLTMGLCLDLIYLAQSMLAIATGNVALLRRQSEHFAENLDYCFGRAHLHGLSLSLLSMSTEKADRMRNYNRPHKIKLCWLASILPVPPMAPEDSTSLWRLILPLVLFQGFPYEDTKLSQAQSVSFQLYQVSRHYSIKDWLIHNPPFQNGLRAMLEYLKVLS